MPEADYQSCSSCCHWVAIIKGTHRFKPGALIEPALWPAAAGTWRSAFSPFTNVASDCHTPLMALGVSWTARLIIVEKEQLNTNKAKREKSLLTCDPPHLESWGWVMWGCVCSLHNWDVMLLGDVALKWRLKTTHKSVPGYARVVLGNHKHCNVRFWRSSLLLEVIL